MRRRPDAGVLIAAVIICVMVTWAVAGPLIAPFDGGRQDLAVGVSAPGGPHLLGTDRLGRDVLSRVIEGTRAAVAGPAVIALGAMLIGITAGLTAGYRGGWIDGLIMRLVDLLYSLPALLVCVVVIGVVGGSYWMAVGVLIVLSCPYDIRVIRGAALELRGRPFIEAARVLGTPRRLIMLRELLPNVWPVILANTFLNFAFSLIALASLSFLGVGTAAGSPEWGRMVFENRLLLTGNAWAAIAPAVAIIAAATAMNLLGDWLEERISTRGRLA